LIVKIVDGIFIQIRLILLEFQAEDTDLEPAPGKDFTDDALKRSIEFLKAFPKDKKIPKKPLLIFVTFNDWLDHNFDENFRQWLEDFLKPKSFYDLIDLFNCAFYLQIDLLREIVAARIAHSISYSHKLL
jgi:hypothetical protein